MLKHAAAAAVLCNANPTGEAAWLHLRGVGGVKGGVFFFDPVSCDDRSRGKFLLLKNHRNL